MLTTFRGDRDRGVGGATPKGIGAIWSSSENRGITIHPNFNSPLEIMMAADAGQVLFKLMIEELYAKTRVDRGLIWIRNRSSHLVQTETHKQFCFVRNLMIDPN